jgi:hypothetical protein
LINREDVVTHLVEFQQLLATGSLGEQRTVMRAFVERIEKDGENIIVHYTLPVPPALASPQPTAVLDSVRLGGDRGTRTPNLCDANAALSQLSYIPN